jgi:cAMP-dependent protein kinase regulator
LYVVGSGEYDCSKIIHGTETYLKTYKIGESFGELALMYTAPRAASIKCSKSGVLYGLDRQTFKHIVEEAANKRRDKFRSILGKVSILSEIDPYEREQLCDILKEETYEAGDYVVK